MSQDWVPESLNRDKALYQAIADAIEADISTGRLQTGGKLPPQRRLAEQLGIDFTTVTRAYREASKRGLIKALVGKGTFVQGKPSSPRHVSSGDLAQPAFGEIDMGMNMPPVPTDPDIITRMHREMTEVTHRLNTRSLFGYQDFVGSPLEREQAAGWVRRFLPSVTADQLLVCSGTQSALLSLALFLLEPGDVVASEALTYPGFKILMQQLGNRHIGLELDEHGIVPASLRKACREHKVKVLYCTPTLHNPTTVTWPRSRRVAIANIAREFDVKIIEDDAYGGLAAKAPPPLTTFAPERSYYVIGLAKCLSSALRISFLCVPDDETFQALSVANRATSMMASPITKAMALQLLTSGCADLVVKDIQKQVKRRQQQAHDTLPKGSFTADAQGFHVWLRLGSTWTLSEFTAKLLAQGVRLVGGDMFALGQEPPNAVRLCLGVPQTNEITQETLSVIADVLRHKGAANGAVV